MLNPTSVVGLSAPRWRRRTNPLAAAAGLFDLDRSSPWRRHPRKMRSTLVRWRPLLDLAPHGVGPLGCSPRRRDPKQRLRRLGAELPLSLSIAASFLGEVCSSFFFAKVLHLSSVVLCINDSTRCQLQFMQ